MCMFDRADAVTSTVISRHFVYEDVNRRAGRNDRKCRQCVGSVCRNEELQSLQVLLIHYSCRSGRNRRETILQATYFTVGQNLTTLEEEQKCTRSWSNMPPMLYTRGSRTPSGMRMTSGGLPNSIQRRESSNEEKKINSHAQV